LKRERLACLAVAVTDERKTLFAHGFGGENARFPERRVHAESLFRIASVTKIVTGLTLMQLVEEGKLSLDDPIRSVLPDMAFPSKEMERDLTLRHLMSHTGGFPAEYTPDGPREEFLAEKELLERIPRLVPVSAPREMKYLYSNWGIRLAALMAQRVTGRLYTHLARERVLIPLGMNQTTFDLHEAATFSIALPHREVNGSFQVIHRLEENALRYAAGGLYSNVSDLSRLARCLLNEGKNDAGERVVGRESILEMRKCHVKTPKGFYGLTTVISPFRGRFLYGHTGLADPYTSVLYVDPETGYGVTLLMNPGEALRRTPLAKEVLDLVLSGREISL